MKNAVCLGTFDGVHIGHRAVIDSADGFNRIAVTFKKPPKMIFSGKDELIYTFEDKCKILKNAGINEIATLDFEAVRSVSPEDFLLELYRKYRPEVIACGFNYNFGKNGEGNTDLLKDFCQKNGIELKISKPMEYEGETVSSTLIRGYLKNGDIKKANTLLFEPFSFTSAVKKGAQRGRTIGFPTINQNYPLELVTLKRGVYKSKICFEGREYLGISDIGVRPTYPLDFVISETFIKDFSGDLYGKNVKIIPMEFLRDEMKFNNIDALKEQIIKDINKI